MLSTAVCRRPEVNIQFSLSYKSLGKTLFIRVMPTYVHDLAFTKFGLKMNWMTCVHPNSEKTPLKDVSGPTLDADVGKPSWESSFRKSRWFTRGWTLQELVAPAIVEFFSKEGEQLGSKRSLERHIHEVTRIPVKALRGSLLSDFSAPERMLWVADRDTTRKEDKAYSLLGIFDIYLPLIYGEGRENAFRRLREEIDRASKG